MGTIDPAYYTVADGDGHTRAARDAAVNVVATQDLSRSAAHPFYTRLNQILDRHDFDGYVEGLCHPCYADNGRPGLLPGRYFRLLLIGYFEGLHAERAIRMACGRFVCAARVSWAGVAGVAGGPFDDLAHTSPDRSRNSPGRVQRGSCRDWPTWGRSKGRQSASMRRRWKPMPPCAPSCGATRGRTIRIS